MLTTLVALTIGYPLHRRGRIATQMSQLRAIASLGADWQIESRDEDWWSRLLGRPYAPIRAVSVRLRWIDDNGEPILRLRDPRPWPELFARLRSLPAIDRVCVDGPAVDGRLWAHVAGLANVGQLELSRIDKPLGCDVWRQIAQMQCLRQISFWKAYVTESECSMLVGLKNLEALNFDQTACTPEMISRLAACPRLRNLGFAVSLVGDRSAFVNAFAQLPHLAELTVDGDFGDEDLRQLRALLPRCQIVDRRPTRCNVVDERLPP